MKIFASNILTADKILPSGWTAGVGSDFGLQTKRVLYKKRKKQAVVIYQDLTTDPIRMFVKSMELTREGTYTHDNPNGEKDSKTDITSMESVKLDYAATRFRSVGTYHFPSIFELCWLITGKLIK